MADDPRKLRKLLEILNENNVVSYKDASGIEIVIDKEVPAPVVIAPSVEGNASSYSLDEFGEPNIRNNSQYSDEEMLLWSADGGAA